MWLEDIDELCLVPSVLLWFLARGGKEIDVVLLMLTWV